MKKVLIAALLFTNFLATGASASEKANVIVDLAVTEKGFEPNQIKVKPGSYVILNVTRKTNQTCATQIKITERKINLDLPLNKMVSVDVGVLQKGDITFACGMDMITGHIIVN